MIKNVLLTSSNPVAFRILDFGGLDGFLQALVPRVYFCNRITVTCLLGGNRVVNFTVVYFFLRCVWLCLD